MIAQITAAMLCFEVHLLDTQDRVRDCLRAIEPSFAAYTFPHLGCSTDSDCLIREIAAFTDWLVSDVYGYQEDE